MRRDLRLLSLIPALVLACAVFFLSGCGTKSSALAEAESAAVTAVCGIEAVKFIDITADALSRERAAKFPAAEKVYRFDSLYAFIVQPVAYNGPVKLLVVIDGDTGESIGMRIIEHKETEHYVRDMESSWFTERFSGKNAGVYLKHARLKARLENEIVAITGATVSTEGIINGVNAAFGVYQEYVLGRDAQDVPYKVRFEPSKDDGPVETGSLAVRAYGLVLADITLDEIKSLPSVLRTMSIHSTAGVTTHTFRGTLLSNVLALAEAKITDEYADIPAVSKPDSAGYEKNLPNSGEQKIVPLKEAFRWALAVGIDDYISGVSMDEILAENSVYVMYEDNGEPLPKKNGEPGAMRIVVLDDVFGQRFTNYLLEIILENEEVYG